MHGVRSPEPPEAKPSDRPQLTPRRTADVNIYSWSAHMVTVGLFAVLYIANSSGLIAYNKWLVNKERFPYAAPLCFLHATLSSAFIFIMYFVRPQWFSSLTDPSERVPVDRNLILKGAVPVAALLSMSLVLSNTAYLHCSVAFLQMMKETNLVLVYMFSLLASLERFSWYSVALLLFIMLATTLTIHGELNFSPTGFMMQGIGQVCECTKIVLQAMLLSSTGKKLDVLTYTMLVMPLCCLFLGGGLIYLNAMPHANFATPHLHEILFWSPHLLSNALLAFTLNLVIALFVKHSSAVAYLLAGICKDAMVVATGAWFLHEVVSLMQKVGFAMQLSGILVWSLIKLFPSKFENGVILGLADLIGGFRIRSPLGKDVEKCYGAAGDQTKEP